MELKFNKELYSPKVLFRACYRFTERAYVHLDMDKHHYLVMAAAKDDKDTTDYLAEISNQIIEEVNRESILEQTKDIRRILFARSMASTVLYETPTVDIDTDVDDKSAMKDWFRDE